MKIAIYSPYLDTLGGGERYILTAAQILSKDSTVDLLIDNHLESLIDKDYLEKVETRFDLDLKKVNLVNAPIGKGSSLLVRFNFLKRYDVLLYLTDGSIFFSSAKKSFLHIQSPLQGQAQNIFGRIKLLSWSKIIYNSNFTREHAIPFWPIKSDVVYPPVDTKNIKPFKKKKYILSVGRFFGYLREKKHELMIDAFAKLYREKDIKDWSLHLAGSAGGGDKKYLEELKNRAGNLPINFYPNINYQELVRLYGESSIYWHAMGFNEIDPTKMEHFGITTVEAMAAGCVPVVISKGGQKEIVTDNENGFLWQTVDELNSKTFKLIEQKDLLERLSKKAQDRAKDFSKESFEEKIKKEFYG